MPSAASAVSSPWSRAIAPARSCHQPSARDPITFAPSTISVTGTRASRMTGQAAAKPGCSGSEATSSAGIQAVSVASRLGRTANGSAAWPIRVW